MSAMWKWKMSAMWKSKLRGHNQIKCTLNATKYMHHL